MNKEIQSTVGSFYIIKIIESSALIVFMQFAFRKIVHLIELSDTDWSKNAIFEMIAGKKLPDRTKNPNLTDFEWLKLVFPWLTKGSVLVIDIYDFIGKYGWTEFIEIFIEEMYERRSPLRESEMLFNYSVMFLYGLLCLDKVKNWCLISETEVKVYTYLNRSEFLENLIDLYKTPIYHLSLIYKKIGEKKGRNHEYK